MSFPPKRDHRITLADAVAMTKAHRAAAANEPKGGMWPREAFEALLAQPGCEGIRIYHGRRPDGSKHMIMVAVNADGADMTASTIMDLEHPCPPFCDASSPLQG